MAVTSGHVYEPTLIEVENLRFVIMDAPTDSKLPAYIEKLQQFHVGVVVRACEPTYSTVPLKKVKIDVLELAFADGAPPPDSIVNDWLDLVESYFSDTPRPDNKGSKSDQSIAVHCVAGLGRAPVLVAIALIEHGMEPYDAIEFIRSRRRGAINSRQVKFLESYKPRRRRFIGCGCSIL
jgi:protein tyrosine phosphatase type 4A